MMKRILSLFGILSAVVFSAQNNLTNTENYTYTKECLNADCTKVSESVQYFDSFGRPFQAVSIKSSPSGKDMVQHIPYDSYGRKVDSWFPVPMPTSGGAVHDTAAIKSNAVSMYGDSRPFSHTVLDNSPLDRVLQQISPGQDWQNHPAAFAYETNINGEVKKYTVSSSWTEGRTESLLSLPGSYPANTLTKNTVTDQDGKVSVEYKNKQGQLIMARKGAGTSDVADTYYVYNEYGHLVYVIPPLASASGSVSQDTLEKLCYQYRYDGWNRLVEKRLPGKGWEYMVYDKAGKVVLTQDAVLKSQNRWLLTNYDHFGRPVYTGIVSQALGRAGWQDMIGTLVISESRQSSGFTKNGMTIYYSHDYFFSDLESVLSVNYYDTYPSYSFNPPVPSQIYGSQIMTDTMTASRSTKTLPVMSLVKNVEDDNWTKNYNWYDIKGRAIGAYTINHLGGYTKTESKLDFAGLTLQTKAYHKRLATDTEKLITQTYDYDAQGRLLVHKHKIDNNPEEILKQNTYNELSQIVNKKVGGTNVSSPLQSIDYTYNIHGWLTKINDPANLNGKLFGYEIRYQNPIYASKASGKFDGNITEVDWKNASENILKRYSYAYDGFGRLKDAFYAEPDVTNPHNGNYDEYLTYDLNGNIKTLKRKAFPVGGTTSTLVDDLEYQYTGNRLNQVIESAMNDTGYEGGNNMINYDLNGSMTDLKDKGIQSVVYNHLDLPNAFSITHTGPLGAINYSMDYLYRADGTKLRKTYSYIGSRGSAGSVRKTDYLDGFQYSYFESGVSCETCRPESAFEEKAYKGIGFPGTGTPTWTLDFVPTSEGFYSFTENRYIYQYRDHLGNVRISFAKSSTGTIDITDTNNYYPFGLNHIDGQISKGKFGSYQSYKYNGKELQETGMFDYGARMYMPDLGRWGVMDPLAEQMRRHSPYNYAFNNPVNVIDPDGRLPSRLASFYGKNSAFNWEFDPTTSVSGLAWNEMYSGSNFMADDEASGSFMSFFMTNNSISGFTVRGYMAGAMFQSIMSGVSSIDSILGGFNYLRDQIINAGLGSNPEKTQASFNDWEKLTDKVPELNKLFSKAPSVFIPVTGENYLGQQDPFTNRIRISTDKIGSLLEYAYTIGHEMLHVFDDKYNYKKYIDLFSTNDREFERNRYTIPIYMLFKEYRGYSWEKSLGKDVDIDRTMNAYRVRWALPQKTLDFLNSKIKFLSNLFINP